MRFSSIHRTAKTAIGVLFILGCLIGASEARRAKDPRILQVADLIETHDTETLYQTVTASDWTKEVLNRLSESQRKHLAQDLRNAKKPIIREGHLEQYRVLWQSKNQADSTFILTFLMDARPGDLLKPQITFSSQADRLPALMAEALDNKQLTQAMSFYSSGSRWRDLVPKMSPAELKNTARWFHSLQLIRSEEESRHYIGDYIDRDGILRQNEMTSHLNAEGRWEIQ